MLAAFLILIAQVLFLYWAHVTATTIYALFGGVDNVLIAGPNPVSNAYVGLCVVMFLLAYVGAVRRARSTRSQNWQLVPAVLLAVICALPPLLMLGAAIVFLWAAASVAGVVGRIALLFELITGESTSVGSFSGAGIALLVCLYFAAQVLACLWVVRTPGMLLRALTGRPAQVPITSRLRHRFNHLRQQPSETVQSFRNRSRPPES